MSVPQITIPSAVWSPKTLFNYKGKREPFVGVAIDKLRQADEVDIILSFLKTKPMYLEVQTKPFLSRSEAEGWKNKRKSQDIYYLPMSELRKLAKEVRE